MFSRSEIQSWSSDGLHPTTEERMTKYIQSVISANKKLQIFWNIQHYNVICFLSQADMRYFVDTTRPSPQYIHVCHEVNEEMITNLKDKLSACSLPHTRLLSVMIDREKPIVHQDDHKPSFHCNTWLFGGNITTLPCRKWLTGGYHLTCRGFKGSGSQLY